MQSDDSDVLCHVLQDSGPEDIQRDLEHLTVAVFVIRKDGEGPQEPPEDIGIVIEGVKVLHGLTSVASACALLLGLLYALTLLIPNPFVLLSKCSRKSSCTLSNTRCPPKSKICMADFKARSNDTHHN